MSIEKTTLAKKFTQGDFDYDKQKSVEPVYFVYPQYVEQLKQHKIPVTPDMQDKELTNFINRVGSEEITKKIPTVIRLRNINKEGEHKGQKTEFIIWYENWSGKDKNNHKIAPVSDLPKGIDKTVEFSRSTDGEGIDTYKQEDEYWLYTEPYTPEKLDSILEETSTEADAPQYILMGIRPYSGFSYDEFRNLSFAELEERGRTGKVQQPVNRETIAPISHNSIKDKQTKKSVNDSK